MNNRNWNADEFYSEAAEWCSNNWTEKKNFALK